MFGKTTENLLDEIEASEAQQEATTDNVKADDHQHQLLLGIAELDDDEDAFDSIINNADPLPMERFTKTPVQDVWELPQPS
jgi:hypothetical protein